jgi:hypothetical protein
LAVIVFIKFFLPLLFFLIEKNKHAKSRNSLGRLAFLIKPESESALLKEEDGRARCLHIATKVACMTSQLICWMLYNALFTMRGLLQYMHHPRPATYKFGTRLFLFLTLTKDGGW